MNLLLIFFAIPIAIIILSIIFESFINCPLKIAGIIFSIFLIITFVIGNQNLLIATIIYTIIGFGSAWLYEIFTRNNSIGVGCGNNCTTSFGSNNMCITSRNLLETASQETESLNEYENSCCKKYRY